MLVATAVLLAASATPYYDDAGIIHNPKRNRLPAIRSLVIERRGATFQAGKESHPECAAFTLSTSEVRAYFRQSGQVSMGDAHLLDWSPCYTGGRVTFANGKRGTWEIQQLRMGSIRMGDGRIIHLYCPSCRSKAYATEAE